MLIIELFLASSIIMYPLLGFSIVAIAGTILQGLTRNPLAAPEIIGVEAGASLTAVALFVLLPFESSLSLMLTIWYSCGRDTSMPRELQMLS